MSSVPYYILFLIIFGSLNTLTTKWQLTMTSVGIDGKAKIFEKPWWANFAMFFAMILVVIIHWIRQWIEKKQTGGDDTKVQPLLEDGNVEEEEQISVKRTAALTFFPSFLDLVAGGCNFMGLLCISASVWQMLRGSMIIFSAIISIIFLGRKLEAYHWIGIIVCCSGVTCVGAASVLGAGDDVSTTKVVPSHGHDHIAHEHAVSTPSESSRMHDFYGVMAVMLAQVFQAGQCVAEERLLKDVKLPGPVIVGYEGMWGAAIMLVVFFPILGVIPGDDVGGVQENTLDTLVMIYNSLNLKLMLLLYLISCPTYNIARMLITNSLSAVHFTMIDATRTCFIWVLDLGIMYLLPSTFAPFGEQWTDWSWLQIVGFLLQLLGQMIYGRLLKLEDVCGGPKSTVTSL